MNPSIRSLGSTLRVEYARINENNLEKVGGARYRPSLSEEVTWHRPTIVPTVLVVVYLRLGVEMIVVVTKNRIPRNLQAGSVINRGVGLEPERVGVTRDAVLVEVIAERYDELRVRLRGVRCHQPSDR